MAELKLAKAGHGEKLLASSICLFDCSPEERYVTSLRCSTCVVDFDLGRASHFNIDLMVKVKEHDMGTGGAAKALRDSRARR